MKTKIIMYHSSEGASVKEVINLLSQIGFTVSLGSYDYEYEWKEPVDAEMVLDLVDKVINTLKGTNVFFHFSTE